MALPTKKRRVSMRYRPCFSSCRSLSSRETLYPRTVTDGWQLSVAPIGVPVLEKMASLMVSASADLDQIKESVA